jgi:hypothetical protein
VDKVEGQPKIQTQGNRNTQPKEIAKTEPKETVKTEPKETAKTESKETAKTEPNFKPMETSKARTTPTPQKTTKSRPTLTSQTTPSCQNSNYTGKKTTRDIIDDNLLQLLRRAPPGKSAGSAPATTSPNSCEPDISTYYKRVDLNGKKAVHWRFETKEGWGKAVGRGNTARKQQGVMTKMRDLASST